MIAPPSLNDLAVEIFFALYKYDPGIAEGMIRMLFPPGFQYSQLKIEIGKFTSAFVAPSPPCANYQIMR
jgi:hypothetical protein